MEIIFAFKTINTINEVEKFIFETKNMNMPKESLKSDRLKCYFYDEKECLRNLKFSSMDGDLRYFECGMILDMGNLILKLNSVAEEEKIVACDEDEKKFILKLL